MTLKTSDNSWCVQFNKIREKNQAFAFIICPHLLNTKVRIERICACTRRRIKKTRRVALLARDATRLARMIVSQTQGSEKARILTVRRNWISSSASPPSAMMSSVSQARAARRRQWVSEWVRARASSSTALGFHLWRHAWRILILIHICWLYIKLILIEDAQFVMFTQTLSFIYFGYKFFKLNNCGKKILGHLY